MADKAISELTQALQITNEDLFVLEQSGEAKKLKGETLLDFVTLSVVSVTVTTLPAGSSATATYDKSTGTLALGIPHGSKGDTGATGATGPANVLTIGSVTSGKVASATITGEAPNQVLNLVLEKGEKGDKGDKGEKGNAFTYADFTPDQLAALKGEKGDTGSQGEPGPPGKDGITPEIVEGELVTVPSAGGGTDLSLGITGAQVGQIAKITAVDTEGKPTTWEPVDMVGMSNDWMLLADITLGEDSAVIKIDKTPSGGSFSIRELAFFGGIKCDTVNKKLALSVNGKIGYGNPMVNLGEVLNAAESDTEYLAAYVNVLPECLFSRVQHSQYNPLFMNRNTPSFSASALRNEAQIANQSLGDPITVFAIAPWSDGKSGVFKAGTSLKFYGRE